MSNQGMNRSKIMTEKQAEREFKHLLNIGEEHLPKRFSTAQQYEQLDPNNFLDDFYLWALNNDLELI